MFLSRPWVILWFLSLLISGFSFLFFSKYPFVYIVILLSDCVSVGGYLCVNVFAQDGQTWRTGSPGTWIIGGCEPPGVDAVSSERAVCSLSRVISPAPCMYLSLPLSTWVFRTFLSSCISLNQRRLLHRWLSCYILRAQFPLDWPNVSIPRFTQLLVISICVSMDWYLIQWSYLASTFS